MQSYFQRIVFNFLKCKKNGIFFLVLINLSLCTTGRKTWSLTFSSNIVMPSKILRGPQRGILWGIILPSKYNKGENRNSRKRRKICSELTKRTPERSHSHGFCVFIVNFEQILYLYLVFLLLILNK